MEARVAGYGLRTAGEGTETRLPIAIIGAGPVGLVAAAHVVNKGEVPLVLEAGDAVGASVREWAHVRLFTPWKYLTDPVSSSMLAEAGWETPDPEVLPTGGELVERFLEPLAALPQIAPHIRLKHRVEAVTRRGMDKLKTWGREDAPFELVVDTPEGRKRIQARAVIDASGTYRTPNPIGSGGLPVPGERELADRIHYGIPDVLDRARARYAGRRTLVIGSGHSAMNALLELAELAEERGEGEVIWAIRGQEGPKLWGGGENDELPARGSIGQRMRRLVETGAIRLVTGFRTARLEEADGGVRVIGEDGAVVGPVDELVVATGFRPDLSLTREVRVELDPALESPPALAPLIDPNVHSCGSVPPHGARELSHPEQDYYIVGMKSYGRAPTFLLLTGYEQVRSVVCALTGDEEGARAVELVLPETGVCSTDWLPASGCCGPESTEASSAVVSNEPEAACGDAGCGDDGVVAAGLPVVGAGTSCG